MRQGLKRCLMGMVAAVALAAATGQGWAQSQVAPTGSLSGSVLAARLAESDRDLKAAITYYTRALALDPDNRSLQQSLMLALISDGRFDEALPYADKLKTVPEVERFSRLALGVDALRRKDFNSAGNLLKLALESDLDRLISALIAGWAKVGAGDATEALGQVEGLRGPDWYDVFKDFHRALIAEQGGMKDAADKAYSEMVSDVAAGRSTAPETWMRAAEAYARFLARQGRKADALAVLDKADAFVPRRLAIVELRKAIEAGAPVQPLAATAADGAAEVLLDIAVALDRGGGEPFVKLYLEYARALKPDGDAVLMQLAAFAEQQQNAEAAIGYYQKVPASSPLKRLAELQLGINFADMGRQDEAVAHLSALIAASPDDRRAYLALGGVYSAKEDYKSAADLYERAIARIATPSRDDWNLFYQRGIAYERVKQWPKAEASFKQALELYPDQPNVLNYLGYSWVDMNVNLDDGLKMIRKAVELRPGDGYIVDSLGWAYYRLERFDEAVTELQRAVELKPEDPVLNDHLGDALWRAGRRLEATFQWRHARDMKPDPDVLSSVEKKLMSGLPALPGKAAAGVPAPAVEPQKPAPAPEKRTELVGPEKRAEAVEPQAAAIPAAYKVQRGQSLWSIANDVFGDGRRYIELINLNPQLRRDPGRLLPGQEIRLPAGPR